MMTDWLVEDGPRLPLYVSSFAKAAGGSTKVDEDDDDDLDDDDDDDEDDDDDLAEMSDEELRDALKKTRGELSKASGSSKAKRDRIKKLRRELDEERTKKATPPKKKDDDGEPDLDTIREEARREGSKAGELRAKKAEARSALVSAGVAPERVGRLIGMLDLDDLDLDDEGLDGIDEAIAELKADVPEFFGKRRTTRRESVAGGGDRSGEQTRKKPLTASEKQALIITGGARR